MNLAHFIGGVRDVLALVVLFGVTVFVHELGHFLAALWAGMQVDTFSIGFGPAIWKRKFRGIQFKIGALPLGGYVALPQLDPTGMAAVQGTDAEPGRRLPPVAPWKKIVVSVSGAAGNLVFAVVLAWVVFLGPEVKPSHDGNRALVGFVDDESAAFALGLRAGDEIVAVNGESVKSWNDYAMLCMLAGGQTNGVVLGLLREGAQREVRVPMTETDMGVMSVDGIGKSMACLVEVVVDGMPAAEAGFKPGDMIRKFNDVVVASTDHFVGMTAQRAGMSTPVTVERDGQLIDLTVTPRFSEADGKALIGVRVTSGFEPGKMAWMEHREPWNQIKGDAQGIGRLLKALVTPREAKQAAKGLGGPVLILTTLWVAIKISFLNAVGFLRFLNVNLAILNLLPIPVLDGGHIVFSLWEGITRRPVNARFVNVLVNVFAALLIGVFILLTFRDAARAPRIFRAIGLLSNREAPAAVASPTNAVSTNAAPAAAAEDHAR